MLENQQAPKINNPRSDIYFVKVSSSFTSLRIIFLEKTFTVQKINNNKQDNNNNGKNTPVQSLHTIYKNTMIVIIQECIVSESEDKLSFSKNNLFKKNRLCHFFFGKMSEPHQKLHVNIFPHEL